MTPLIIILALFAVVILLFLGTEGWRRFWRHGDALQKLSGQLIPVDLEAFENLVDPEEEQFLRTRLSPREFRGVQRSRIRAAKVYVGVLSQNAAVLIAVGHSARSSADPGIAAAGQEIEQRAVRLKIWCLLSRLRMNAAFVLPGHLSLTSRIANRYMLVSYLAANLSERAVA